MRPLVAVLACVVAAAAALLAARCSDEERPGRSDTGVPAAAGDGTVPSADRAPVEGDLRADRRRRVQRGDERHSPAADTDDPPPAPPEGVTTGVVRLRSGDPVVGAFVGIGDLDTSDCTTTSDALGRFALQDGVSYGSVSAFAVIDGVQHYGSVDADGFGVHVDVIVDPAPPTDPFHIVRIVGHDGGAVGSAVVQLVRGERHRAGWRTGPIAAAGGVALIRSREYLATEDKAAFIVSGAEDAAGRPLPYGPALVVLAPWSREESTVRPPPGDALVGRAEGPDGAPLAGVPIRIAAPPPAGYDGDHMAPVAERWIRTADDGSFRVEGLAAGTATLWIEPDYVGHGGRAATATVGARSPVVLRCDEIHAVRLRVVNEDHLPLGGIPVSATHDTPPTETLPDGTIELMPLSPHDFRSPTRTGSASLIVNGLPALEWVRVNFAPGTTEHTVRLRRVVTICGVALGPDGRPIPGVPVVINRSPQRRADWGAQRFSVTNIPASESATLSIRGPGNTWVDATVAADAPRSEDIVLELPAARDSLSIYVGGAREPISVALRGVGADIARVDDAEALAHFEIGAEVKRVDVQAGPDSSGRFALLRDVAPRGFLRVDLVQGVAISGRVTTAEGHDVPYADLVVTTPDGFRASAKADSAGVVRLPGVPAGRVTVSATWRNRRGQVEIDAPSDKLEIVID